MFNAILDLLFPPKCPFCQGLLQDGQALLCPDCQRELPWLRGKQGEGKTEFVDMYAAPLHYRDSVRQSHHRYKFSGVLAYVRPYTVLMGQCISDHLQGSFDVIAWVPLSPWRRFRRGYDQAYLLAKGLEKQLGVPCRRLLKKVRETKPQSDLKSESERRANVLGAYKVCAAEEVKGKRVLLVDDVLTTGATVSECARMQRTAGAAQVVCAALALSGQRQDAGNGKSS